LLDRHRGANYKILPPGPIGLLRHYVFSTLIHGLPYVTPDPLI
jgi:hypothetical protein